MRPCVDKSEKLEKIKEIEYNLDSIRSLVERVDERANGVMYASGALAIFYLALLTLITKLDIDLASLVADHSVFIYLLFGSLLCSVGAFVFSIISIYPRPFNVDSPEPFLFCWDNGPGKNRGRLLRYLRDDLDISWAKNVGISKSDDCKTILISNDENSAEIELDEKEEKAILKLSDGRTRDLKVKKENDKLNIYGGTKGKKGQRTLENFKEPQKTLKCASKVDKKKVCTSSKSKILEFGDGTKMEIKFEPILRIGKPNPGESAESCQNMDVDEILYFKCATLHGQKLAVVRKYNWLRMALIVLTGSVVFLIPFIYLILKFIPGLVC